MNPFFDIFLPLGVLLVITALLIKLAVAPFHEWVADIYEGIPTPTALFFATIPKISNFFILVRLVQNVFEVFWNVLQPFLVLICIFSLILGSLNAFKQQNIKRFLAFSSVNHFGFILLGLIVGTKTGIAASFFLSCFLYNTYFWCLDVFNFVNLCKYSQGLTTVPINENYRVRWISKFKPRCRFFYFVNFSFNGGYSTISWV